MTERDPRCQWPGKDFSSSAKTFMARVVLRNGKRGHHRGWR
jgi:hypothetical protein